MAAETKINIHVRCATCVEADVVDWECKTLTAQADIRGILDEDRLQRLAKACDELGLKLGEVISVQTAIDLLNISKSAEASAVCAEYDIIEKEVVLWRATKSQMLFVDEPKEMELLGSDQYTELSRTTVQFRVPRSAKKTLAQRLEDWDNHGGSLAEWDAIVADARGLEGEKL